eukprot:6197312-Pleurochrysis_carterae.AAC.4
MSDTERGAGLRGVNIHRLASWNDKRGAAAASRSVTARLCGRGSAHRAVDAASTGPGLTLPAYRARTTADLSACSTAAHKRRWHKLSTQNSATSRSSSAKSSYKYSTTVVYLILSSTVRKISANSTAPHMHKCQTQKLQCLKKWIMMPGSAR